MSAVTLSSPVAEAWSQSEQLVSRTSRGKLVVLMIALAVKI